MVGMSLCSMMEGEVLERILVVVCSHLEAGATLVGSLVIAVDMAGEAVQDHNVRSGS